MLKIFDMKNRADYDTLLASLAEGQPLLSADLGKANVQRAARLATYLGGARLKGLEQLTRYLLLAEESYSANEATAQFAFLVRRVRADFQTALEAALSGFGAVASDAMRDVMEIEALLLLFAVDSGSGVQWLTCDSKTRRNQFPPVKVRARLSKAGIPPFSNDGFEPVDYRAHSESLHVTPGETPLTSKGLTYGHDGLFDDLPFVEMFEHGNRAMAAIEMFRIVRQNINRDDYTPLSARDEFDEAYQRTSQMQVIILAFFTAPAELETELGRAPTTSEVLRRVADVLRVHGEAAERSAD